METTTTTVPAHGWPMECINFADLLKTVTDEITAFEAKQLGKLKGELEAFDKKKNSVVDAYKLKYPALRDRWCRQNADIEGLHRNLTCIFKDKWKKYITECACPRLNEITEAETALQTRLSLSLGKLELARNKATDEFGAAKTYLDTLITNQANLETEFTNNEKAIAEIKALLQGPESPVAIQVFWLKLLPNHIRLAPDDLLHCLKFAQGQSPEELCPSKVSAGGTAVTPMPHPVPWLVDKDKYSGEIDCAWTLYRDARKTQGDAEAAFKATPDDIATKTKQLEEMRKALDGKIRDCLKNVTTTTGCDCGEPAMAEPVPVEATDPAEQASPVPSAKQQAPKGSANRDQVNADTTETTETELED